MTIVKYGVVALISLIIFFALCVGGFTGCKAYNRAQARADANNQVKITHIQVSKAQQQALINNAQIQATVAEAKKRVAEAKGLAAAQKLIDHTLTPLYVQHEAIQAQEQIATSGKNNTIIYVPAGTNGTPIITQQGNPTQGVYSGR